MVEQAKVDADQWRMTLDSKEKELEAEKAWMQEFETWKIAHESGCAERCECGGDVASKDHNADVPEWDSEDEIGPSTFSEYEA